MTTDTTAQTDALLPCPFCGQSERLAEEWKDEDKHPLLLIGCDTRGCPGESREHYLLNGVRERAVAAWNRRALASSPAPLGGAWKPIETAPKDGTTFLFDAPDLEDRMSLAFYRDGRLVLALNGKPLGSHITPPRLWHPLPTPPERPEGQESQP